jgi:NtrC-family two-component system sensor histidine kinase KinB
MKLKNKIGIWYGVVFILMTTVVAWGIFNLVSLGKATDAILRQNYRSIIAAEKMVDAIERQDSGILRMFLGDTEKGISMFHDNETEFIESLGDARDSMYVKGEEELNRLITAYYEGYRKQFSLMVDAIERNKSIGSSPLLIYEESIYPEFLKVRETCIKLRDLNEQAMYNSSVQAGEVAKRAIWSTVIVAIGGLVGVLVLSLFLAGRIVKPLYQFMDASRKISSGDYTTQVKVDTNDELGSLGREFNKMVLQLGHYHEMDIDRIITEKNKNEGIISSIDDGLVVFDTDLKVGAINPSARKILNLGFGDSTNLKCADVIPDINVNDLIRKTLNEGTVPNNIPDEQRVLVLKREGKAYQYMFSTALTKGKNGEPSGILLLLRDVTRIKEVERLKNDFIMAASHELRTPLTSMGMSIDLLMEHVAPKLPEKERDLIITAHDEVQRMKALVNDLLDLSKIEAGKIDLEIENIPVQTLFENINEVFSNQIEIKNVRLSSEVPAGIPGVRADQNKIIWVLSNLISNALRYVPSEGGHIHLSADNVGQHVHLSVKDNGPGIPLEYQSKIFQKFVKVNGDRSGGTGLGLTICREIVRALRGTIWVESSPGNGSTFTFTLPVAQ